MSTRDEKEGTGASAVVKAVGVLLGAACVAAPLQDAQASEVAARAATTVQQSSAQDLDGAFVHPGVAAMVRRAMTGMRPQEPEPWYQWTVRF